MVRVHSSVSEKASEVGAAGGTRFVKELVLKIHHLIWIYTKPQSS
jgi:hypothetical protein